MKYPAGFVPTEQSPFVVTDVGREIASALRTRHEDNLLDAIRKAGLPEPERECRFDTTRRWRADFAYESQKILIEVEGGHWTGGRHKQRDGFAKDVEKYNAAALAGFCLIRIIPEMIEDGSAVEAIRMALRRAT